MPHDPESSDVIEQLRADLQRNAAELDVIFDMLPMGVGIAYDRECQHIRVNRAFAQLLGIEHTENASLTAPSQERPLYRVFKNGREVEPAHLPMQTAARDGIVVRDVELEVVHENGRRVFLYAYAAPLYDLQRRPRGAFGAFVDITERRRIEEQQRFLADASRVLSSSLDYGTTLRALAQLCVPDLGDFCAIDVFAEDGAFARVEFVTADPARQPIADTLREYPPLLAADSPVAEAIRSGEPMMLNDIDISFLERSAQSPEHLRLRREFGARTLMVVPIRVRARTLGLLTVGRFTAGRPYTQSDLSIAMDVGVRAGLALDNALLYGDAQEANRLKDEFLATLSHELRTPLNALLGWAQMLKSRPLDEAGRRRAIESIERNARSQTVLIDDLLDVSRAISGKLRLDFSPVDLQSVVFAATDAVKPAVRARGLELSVSMMPIPGEVIGDPDRLQQVVWNVLSNAVKFTPPGGRVELAIQEAGGAVQIAVTDTGIGIEKNFLPFMFERFRQADSSTTRQHGGLGLGLAIVRHLVDLHGGTVTASSEGPGTGTRVVVTLPLRRQSAPVAQQPELKPEESSTQLRGVRVLVVDDDADSRELILITMQLAGAEVLSVGSGAAALAALDSFSPHVIVADIAMPGIDGYELMRRVVARSGGGAPRGIALSAYVSAEDAQRAREAGFDVHLSKPADYGALVRTIAELTGSQPGVR
jgi:PAS domain S-box-containing protein